MNPSVQGLHEMFNIISWTLYKKEDFEDTLLRTQSIFQIKEGAENLRKVAKDKKSVSDVNHIVKKSNTKLSELQAELQELDSQLLVTQGNLPTSPMAPGNCILLIDHGWHLRSICH